MNAQHVLALEEQHFAAMVAGDVAALERLLDDALTYTHSSGAVDTKASYIAGVRDKLWDYKAIVRENERVVLRGDTALAFCRLRIDVVASGAARKVDSSALAVWVRNGADWRLLAVHSTPNAA
jgi:hypothetical protein